MATSSPTQPSSARPRSLLAVGVALALEVLALLVASVVAIIGVARGAAADPGAGLVIGTVALLLALFLAAALRALWQGRRWPRGPVITWQLLQATVAAPQLGGDQTLIGIALLVPVVVVVVGLLLPPVVRYTTTPR